MVECSVKCSIVCSGSVVYLENAIFNRKDRYIEGATTKIEDEDISFSGSVTLLVKAVGDGSGGRFVDDSQNVESSNYSGIFSGLSLGVVEVGWDCNYGI